MPAQYVLSRVQNVAAPLREVALFFEDPGNLGEITPPFLDFRIVTKGPIEMKEGALIDYTIRLHGVPLRWQTRIDHYVPGVEFVDLQIKGPYKYWHHHHTFRETPGGTEIGDTVTYELPFGPLGRAVHAAFVARQLEQIFRYRAEVIREKFGQPSLGALQVVTG
jgi:ligand-binding SRPBCC domain-containing protein